MCVKYIFIPREKEDDHRLGCPMTLPLGFTRIGLFASSYDDRTTFVQVGHRGHVTVVAGAQSDHSPVDWSQSGRKRERVHFVHEGDSSTRLNVGERALRDDGVSTCVCVCVAWNDGSPARRGAVSTFQSDVNTKPRSGSSAPGTVDENGHAQISQRLSFRCRSSAVRLANVIIARMQIVGNMSVEFR